VYRTEAMRDKLNRNFKLEASKDLLFISWAPYCSRSDSLAVRLGGFSVMVYSPFWGSRYGTIVFKYLSQSLKTIKVLLKHKPRTIFVMSPPIVACLPVWLYATVTGGQYVIDAHTAAFLDRRCTPLLFLHKFFSRRAIVTLVTGTFLESVVRKWGANAMVVGDVPVCFAQPRRVQLPNRMNMTFICTFAEDEPVDAFLKAAARFPHIGFYVTGNLRKANRKWIEGASANVTFTGFLDDSGYVGLLLSSDAVLCLTTEDHTMQRGAYEAVYLGKPVITSEFEILRNAFNLGAVHVKSDPDAIANGIRDVEANLEMYQREVEQMRRSKLASWTELAKDLNQLLGRASAQSNLPDRNPSEDEFTLTYSD